MPTQGRVLDTRAASQVGPYSTAMPANGWRTVQITGLAGVPTSGAAAVAANFTVVNPPSGGYLKADKNETTPNDTVTYLNWSPGQAQSNSGVVAIGTDGKIQVMASTSADLVVDVQGYYTAGDPAAGGYVPVTQTRLVDTRNGTGLPNARITSGSTKTIQVSGLGNVPSDASAVMLNFLVATPTNSGHMSAYPADGNPPNTWLNFGNGGSDTTSMAVELSTTSTPLGAIKVNTFVNNSGTIDLVADVLGYFTATPGAGGAFTPAAARVYDSRNSTPNDTLVGGAARTIQVAGVAGVPSAGVSAVLVNIIVPDPNGTNGGWTRAWPSGGIEPTPSIAVQYQAGLTSSNVLPVALGSDGAIQIRNAGSDTVNIVVDVEGWYSKPIAAPSSTTLCATPSVNTSCDSGEVTSTPNPTLTAMTTDPTGAALTYSFEVWASDGTSAIGSAPLASTSVGPVTSGVAANYLATLDAPVTYQFRARASDGLTVSSWSPWLIFTTEPASDEDAPPGSASIDSRTVTQQADGAYVTTFTYTNGDVATVYGSAAAADPEITSNTDAAGGTSESMSISFTDTAAVDVASPAKSSVFDAMSAMGVSTSDATSYQTDFDSSSTTSSYISHDATGGDHLDVPGGGLHSDCTTAAAGSCPILNNGRPQCWSKWTDGKRTFTRMCDTEFLVGYTDSGVYYTENKFLAVSTQNDSAIFNPDELTGLKAGDVYPNGAQVYDVSPSDNVPFGNCQQTSAGLSFKGVSVSTTSTECPETWGLYWWGAHRFFTKWDGQDNGPSQGTRNAFGVLSAFSTDGAVRLSKPQAYWWVD